MARFTSLKVRDVRPETSDSVSIALDIPDEQRAAFRYSPGQYLTLRHEIDGQDVRRSYSICSGLDDGEIRVAVKRVEGGAFSCFANDGLKPGDMLDVMLPEGRFTVEPDPEAARTYVAFAAGSGITPVLSIAKSVLAAEPESRFTLFYGNRSVREIMFREALLDLKNRYPSRFSVLHVLSREPQEAALLNGRIDREKCESFFRSILNVHAVDRFFLCGPEGMIGDVRAALAAHGVEEEKVLFELFAPAGDAAAKAAAARRSRLVDESEAVRAGADVAIILDGVRTEFTLGADDVSILDAALGARPDLPYACKGGMCCTCRAKVLEGRVEMDLNYTLAKEEVERGFVLTCQSHPASEKVVLDFDAR
ncbi:1,2-phenylacetyl-CoA epoxidase subunit PaaE [Nisaea nitritireducens]|uniref:1,2-phenylacetyl-CoA epoxidase subunit PaaE n=1 Tax=Nisaea nitritireducens TaxID=568392 RepID=UPI0018667EFB|nr:1,2-phenylacetyl-CoA epoxidase subunit PaaE [Nisaea nitritireducens]